MAYLDMPVRQFLEALAAPGPDPGGGAAAALTVTLAAGLCAMSARLSQRHLPQAAAIAEEAERLRGRAAPLAQADVAGYQAVVAALRGGAGPEAAAAGGPGTEATEAGGGPALAEAREARRQRLAAALSQASATPMEVAEIAASVAALAAATAAHGNPSVRGDAITSAVLAAAAARSAAELVRINLRGAEDARPARADRLAAAAAEHAREIGRPAGPLAEVAGQADLAGVAVDPLIEPDDGRRRVIPRAEPAWDRRRDGKSRPLPGATACCRGSGRPPSRRSS